jgi:hypothetical protein
MSEDRVAPTIDDRSVAIYHVVYPHEGFAESARTLFRLVRRAQGVKPGKNRKLFLDIEGRRNSDGSFDADMLELQNAFLLGFLAPFLSEVCCPLVTLRNPGPQDDDIPLELVIEEPDGTRR